MTKLDQDNQRLRKALANLDPYNDRDAFEPEDVALVAQALIYFEMWEDRDSLTTYVKALDRAAPGWRNFNITRATVREAIYQRLTRFNIDTTGVFDATSVHQG